MVNADYIFELMQRDAHPPGLLDEIILTNISGRNLHTNVGLSLAPGSSYVYYGTMTAQLKLLEANNHASITRHPTTPEAIEAEFRFRTLEQLDRFQLHHVGLIPVLEVPEDGIQFFEGDEAFKKSITDRFRISSIPDGDWDLASVRFLRDIPRDDGTTEDRYELLFSGRVLSLEEVDIVTFRVQWGGFTIALNALQIPGRDPQYFQFSLQGKSAPSSKDAKLEGPVRKKFQQRLVRVLAQRAVHYPQTRFSRLFEEDF